MAEMNMPQTGGRRKVHAPRIDFTPMVDLGFLLITFFMYTTTMATPRVMTIDMPSEQGDPTPVSEDCVITLIPVRNHEVVYYEHALAVDSQLKKCTVINVRNVLLNKKRKVEDLSLTASKKKHKMYVIIKPMPESKYGDLVHILDEMTIIDAPDHTLMDVSDAEREMIQKKF